LGAKDLETLDGLVGDLPWWLRPPSTLLRDLKRRLAGVEAIGVARPELLNLPENLDVVVVGRASSCDVRLADQSVSRRHAQLRRQDDGWRVVDLLSTNGTFLNGRRISSAIALPGDQLGFGLQLVALPT
jgi:pSer/pThr/pTyr-binding forkhead associated (FHA) protein